MALLISVLDLVPLVEGDSSIDALRNATELARAVDRFGYHRLWYAEHHNMPGVLATTPEIMIAQAGYVTKRIRLGSGGVMLPNHSPLKVAESYKLLEAMYPGRIDLGIGRAPGTDRVTALALRRSREALTADDFGEQFDELVAWGGGKFPSNSLFRSVRAMPDDMPLPPVYLLGSSDHSALLAAQVGVGFAFAGHFSADPPEPAMLGYRTRFSSTGALKDPHAILALAVYCAETEQAAQRLASSMQLAFVRLRTGRPGRLPSPNVAMEHVFAAEEAVIADFYKHLAIVGTPEQVRARIEDVVSSTQADEIMIATQAFDPAARIRSYELIARNFNLQPSRDGA